MTGNLKILFKKYFYPIYLSGILILAVILRLNHLALRPFWVDEASITNPLMAPWGNSWQTLVNSGNNAAYFYLLKCWSLFFGDSEAALRSLSVIFSLLSILAIYKFGVRLKGKVIGLWAAFLLAVNYFGIFYAIQARQYSLVILLSILSYYYFFALLEDKKFKNFFWYIIFTVLGIYTHPWFLLLLASQFFYLLLKNKKIIKIFISQLFIILLSLPWLKILWEYKENGANSWIVLTSFKTLIYTFHYFTYGSTGIYILFGLIALIFIIGHFKLTKKMIYYKLNHPNHLKINSQLILLLNYLFFPLLTALVIGHFIPFYEAGRYEAIILPPFILLFALLFSRINNVFLASFLIILLTIFSGIEVIKEKNQITNQVINERSTAVNFLSMAENNDWLIFTGTSQPAIDYYITRLNFNKKNFIKISFPEEISEHPAYQDINKIIKNNNGVLPSTSPLINKIASSGHGRIWLVFTDNNPFATSLRNALRDKFEEQKYLPGPSYVIILYNF